MYIFKVRSENGYGFLRPGLKTGVENGIFWSEIGCGFAWRCGRQPPPKILRSTSPGNKIRHQHKRSPRCLGQLCHVSTPLHSTCEHSWLTYISSYIIASEKDPGPRDRRVFHVESLFTNVHIEGVVQAALGKLGNDADLTDRTTLTPVQIVDLLDSYVLPVQRIDLRTRRRCSHRKLCIHGYC